MTIYIFFGLWIALWIITGLQCKKKQVAQPFAWGFMISMLLMIPIAYLTGMYDDKKPMAEPQPVAQVQPVAQPKPDVVPSDNSTKNIVTAHEFAKDIYRQINENNTYILDAYQHGEKNTLVKLTTTLPQRAIGSFNAYGDDPEYTLAPYYACDNAYVELQSLLFDYSNDLTHNNADSRKQIRYRKARFDEKFAKCKSRVNMTPEQASADYQKEESKK